MIKNEKKLLEILAIVLVIIIAVYFYITTSPKRENEKYQEIDYYYSFDNGTSSFVEDAWKMNNSVTLFYADKSYDRELSKDKKGCLNIVNYEVNDSRYVYELKVHKGAYYHIGVWIQTEDIGYDYIGANISVLENRFYIGDLRGSQEWQYVEGLLYAPENMKIELALRIGGYSNENTGQAWFDDLTIKSYESYDKLPEGLKGMQVHELLSLKSGNEEQRAKVIQYMNPYIVMFLALGILFWLIYLSLVKSNNEEPYAKGYTWLFIVLGLALLVRFIISPFTSGFSSDLALFKYWGFTMSDDPLNFYEIASSCDYPPLYMYLLGWFSMIGRFFGVGTDTALFVLLIKLPPIIADILSGFLIYKLCGHLKIKDNWRIFFAALYVFNPMVILDSTIWGQVDSVWALAVLMGIYLVVREKYILSAFVLTLSIMIKPQGLFVCPVLIFAVVKRKDIVRFLLCAVTVVATLLITTLPYTIKYGPLWIFNLLLGTASGYEYASVNSFNFYTLLGLNWVRDSKKFLGLSYFTWGVIAVAVVFLLVAIIYFRMRKKYTQLPYLAALMFSVWIVVFFVRMHERYMFPAIIFSLILAVLDNSKFMFKIYALITTTSFFNSLIILARYNTTKDIRHFNHVPEVMIISALNILISILIGIYAFIKMKDISCDQELYPVSPQDNVINNNLSTIENINIQAEI